MTALPAPEPDSGPIGPLEPRPFGDYLLLRRLGVGGMGEVYLAKHGSLGGIEKYCVVKTLRPNYTQDREYVSRFIDEARVVVQLNHRNICHVFDVGQVDKQFYLAMEYVPGKDLRAVNQSMIQQGQLLPEDLTIYMIREVLEALDYAHRHRDPRTGEGLNIVHRDVSPQNIMINYEGETKLIDFGLAVSRLKVEHTEPQIVMGKLFYMSPEQARGGVVDQRADIFAIGVTLYEMLVGKRYYEGLSYDEVWNIAGGFSYKPPHWNALRPELQTILERALMTEPEARYQDCSQFLDDLITYQLDRRFRTGTREVRALMQKAFASSIRKEQEFLARAARLHTSDPRFAERKERTQSIRIAVDPNVVTSSSMPIDKVVNGFDSVTPNQTAFLPSGTPTSEERTVVAALHPALSTASDAGAAPEADSGPGKRDSSSNEVFLSSSPNQRSRPSGPEIAGLAPGAPTEPALLASNPDGTPRAVTGRVLSLEGAPTLPTLPETDTLIEPFGDATLELPPESDFADGQSTSPPKATGWGTQEVVRAQTLHLGALAERPKISVGVAVVATIVGVAVGAVAVLAFALPRIERDPPPTAVAADSAVTTPPATTAPATTPPTTTPPTTTTTTVEPPPPGPATNEDERVEQVVVRPPATSDVTTPTPSPPPKKHERTSPQIRKRASSKMPSPPAVSSPEDYDKALRYLSEYCPDVSYDGFDLGTLRKKASFALTIGQAKDHRDLVALLRGCLKRCK